MAEYKVEWVNIAGNHIPAENVVCKRCNKLWLETDFQTDIMPWIATCPEGHQFTVDPRPQA